MKPSYEWTIEKTRLFSVTVRSWHTGDGFGWNVYAYIFEEHPLFNNLEAAYNLPFHGGCTYQQIITTTPPEMTYDWQKEYKSLKVGSDYQHYMDDHFMLCDPANGIPYEIMRDAETLVQSLQVEQEST
jgi:hypothetical protein